MEAQFICMETPAFYAMLDTVVEYLKEKNGGDNGPKWITADEAMKMLRITSRTTLQKMRDEGQIRYTQPTGKIILYDKDSINDYLEDYVYDPFAKKQKRA